MNGLNLEKLRAIENDDDILDFMFNPECTYAQEEIALVSHVHCWAVETQCVILRAFHVRIG